LFYNGKAVRKQTTVKQNNVKVDNKVGTFEWHGSSFLIRCHGKKIVGIIQGDDLVIDGELFKGDKKVCNPKKLTLRHAFHRNNCQQVVNVVVKLPNVTSEQVKNAKQDSFLLDLYE
jgi:hypothetical protein